MRDLIKVMIWLMLLSPVTGTLAAMLARAKGRNGMMGFGAGFLLGVFGLILVAVLPSFKVRELGSPERMHRAHTLAAAGVAGRKKDVRTRRSAHRGSSRRPSGRPRVPAPTRGPTA
jgi:hypothetical protein